MITRAVGGKRARCGISEWLVAGEYQQAGQLFDDACTVGLKDIRLAVTLDQWNSAKERAWYQWLVANAAERFEVVIALHRLPPYLSYQLSPAWVHESSVYQQFFKEVCEEMGNKVQWLELADPLGVPAWPDVSPKSIELLSNLGLESAPNTCLGGLSLDVQWLALAHRQGLFAGAGVQALSFRQFSRADWADELSKVAEILSAKQALECWLVPDQLFSKIKGHIGLLLEEWGILLNSPAKRVYLNLILAPTEGQSQQGRGLRTADGRPALLGRLLQRGGVSKVQEVSAWARRSVRSRSRGRELIIGGAGFIGCNVAARLATMGHQVVVFDNLTRPGTERNLEWLCQRFPDRIEVLLADVRDRDAVRHAVQQASRIFHFAAQVAVTTSLKQPLFDHEVNTLGTLHILEEMRRQRHPPSMVFTSTNKVYGGLEDVELQATPLGYAPVDAALRTGGIDELRPLKFCSPYGCSKGAAEQYVLDYARTFGLSATVLRMSCIYGPHQFGNEDQGWVAHFIYQVITGAPITFYGDGLQVRDVLYIDDLVEAILAAINHLPATAGEAFNIGGGPQNVLSLRGLTKQLAILHHSVPVVEMKDWRSSDQRYYVSDTSKFYQATGWRSSVGYQEGIRRLYEWMRQELAVPIPEPRSARKQAAL
ncbi:MAG: NAD-dependent epimerase/dehydratase family protein [Candidatus Nitrosoglobus sp.]